jgi:hypothetical protein
MMRRRPSANALSIRTWSASGVQPELRFERLSRNRTGDLAAMPGQAKRNFVPVRRDSWHQVNHVHDLHLLNSAANF